MRVFDISGRLVRVLKDEVVEEPGSHHVAWDGRDRLGRVVFTGVYFCRLDAGPNSATMRMLFLK